MNNISELKEVPYCQVRQMIKSAELRFKLAVKNHYHKSPEYKEAQMSLGILYNVYMESKEKIEKLELEKILKTLG